MDNINQRISEIEKVSTEYEKIITEVSKNATQEIDICVDKIKTFLKKKNYNNQELSELLLELPTVMYYANSELINMTIRKDIAEQIKRNEYDNAFLQAVGTVADKTSTARNKTQESTLTESIYNKVCKNIQNKLEDSERLFDSLRKIMTYKLKEMEMDRKGY